ncbi:MAG TPA: autotransporter outer membrane beta-barrel domain-containing protein, partial [Brevundimonas sp.]
MRKLLATAAAIAPLLVATGVQAEVVVSTTRTTPIQTSNATGTAADNIRFASGGGTNLTSGTAVTVDSSNTLTIDGGAAVNIQTAADNSVAVLVNGGTSTTILINGQVLVSDTLTTYPDTDSDGDVDGPWAVGTNRYGVRLAGAGAVTGNVTIGSSGVVQVEGNNSIGLAVDTNLIGNLNSYGTITAVGDNSVAVRTTAPITGSVTVDGTVTSNGGNSSAAAILGDVSGRLTLQGAMTSSGYRYNQQGTDAFIKTLDPDDLLQTASTVIVGANVGGGVVFDTAPADKDTANTDEDGDGRVDTTEGTASITAYGAAPAVTVGSATRSVTLGVAGTGDNAYGFINRGSIVGNGVYDGVSSNGVLFGVAGGQAVNVAGGILNTGTMAVLSSEADATTVHLAAGASTPILRNDGFITAASATSLASTVNAIRIDAGASLPSFTNNGSLLATSGGGTANVTALVDLSGTLTNVLNTGSFQASLVANEAGDPLKGSTVAMDLRANTTGVTVTQTGILSDTTSTLVDTDNDGVDDVDEPSLVGNVLLGSGADTVNLQNGIMLGDIAFGVGADNLNITGGGYVRGALSD